MYVTLSPKPELAHVMLPHAQKAASHSHRGCAWIVRHISLFEVPGGPELRVYERVLTEHWQTAGRSDVGRERDPRHHRWEVRPLRLLKTRGCIPWYSRGPIIKSVTSARRG